MPHVVRTLTDPEAAYIAGIVDGEGTVSLVRHHGTENRRAVVSVANTEHDLLAYLKATIGAGRITRKRVAKDHHTVRKQLFRYSRSIERAHSRKIRSKNQNSEGPSAMLEIVALSCAAGYLFIVVGLATVVALHARKRNEASVGLVLSAGAAALGGATLVALVPFQATGYVTDIFDGVMSTTSLVILISIGVALFLLRLGSPRNLVTGGLVFAPLAASLVWLCRICWRVFAG